MESMVPESIACMQSKCKVQIGGTDSKQTGHKGWSNTLAGKDVGQANLWNCASMVAPNEVQSGDIDCGEEQWKVSS